MTIFHKSFHDQSPRKWDRAGIELATPGSAVRLTSVARHVTDCATRPGPSHNAIIKIEVGQLLPDLIADHFDMSEQLLNTMQKDEDMPTN